MAEYILLIREDLSKYPIPEEELKALVQAHTQWAKSLYDRGIFKTGYGVEAEGHLLRAVNGEVELQPLQDIHQGIGGFYIIEAVDMAAAVEIARECPTFHIGDSMEVRPLM